MAKNTNPNDDKIMRLRKQIEDKKQALKATETFSPRTNCSLNLDGNSTNIRAITSKEEIISLLVKVNIHKLSVEDLGTEASDFRLSGYKVQDWVTDLRARLAIVDRKQEEDRLKVLEAKLHALLSVDKKVELEIEDLINQIG